MIMIKMIMIIMMIMITITMINDDNNILYIYIYTYNYQSIIIWYPSKPPGPLFVFFLASCSWTLRVNHGANATCQEEYLLAVRHWCQACVILRVTRKAWKYDIWVMNVCFAKISIIWMMLKCWNLDLLREHNHFIVSGISVASKYQLFGIDIFQELVPHEIAKASFPSLFGGPNVL